MCRTNVALKIVPADEARRQNAMQKGQEDAEQHPGPLFLTYLMGGMMFIHGGVV